MFRDTPATVAGEETGRRPVGRKVQNSDFRVGRKITEMMAWRNSVSLLGRTEVVEWVVESGMHEACYQDRGGSELIGLQHLSGRMCGCGFRA